MAERLKIAFFDLEGTIFRKAVRSPRGNVAASLWILLAKKLGKRAEADERKTRDKWNRNEYNGYVGWMEDTIRVYQKHRLKRRMFDRAIQGSQYHPGVKEVFTELEGKYVTSIITGGFKALADRAAVDLKAGHTFAACELFWDEKEEIEHWNLLPCDYKGKVDFMKLLMEEHGAKAKECVFVGDGPNDIHLAKAVGTSICFNGDSQLENVCTYTIRQPASKIDFRAVLKYIR